MRVLQAMGMAIGSILSNKMRSFLTMLGIIIGIFSVIILISIGEGTKKQISEQIQSLGTNLITISITGNRNIQVTTEEITALKEKSGIQDIAPTITGNVTAKAGDKNMNTSVEATIPTYEDIRNIHPSQGRFLVQNDLDNRYKVAVVGVTVADEIFGTRDIVGKILTINGNNFSVIGVLEEKGSTMGGSSDNKIIIPLTTAQRFLKNKNIRTFYVESSSADLVNTAMESLQEFMLKKSNNDSKTFRVFNQTELLSTVTKNSDNMTMMLGGIAAISLLVGGIGIMNIMLVSVTERTREIGIRKALGAKRKAILTQFLIEAIVISGIGGLLGVALGIIGSNLVGKIMGMSLLVSLNVVVVAFGFSTFIGILFGLYPAGKASKMNPIDALRYE